MKTIKHYSLALIATEKVGLRNLSGQFKNTVQHSVLISNQLLRTIRQEIKSTFKFVLRDYREQIRKNEQRVYQDSINMLSGHRNKINRIVGEIPLNSRTAFIKENAELEQLIQSVRLMDPINVLNRGFSITTLNGKTLSASNKAKPGDKIITKTAIFSVESEVTTNNELKNE
jgi:exodeoxyribonuclease VII large subunit